MPESTANSGTGKPPPRLTYIHPVDLLLTRLRVVLEDAGDLVDITLGNYELYYYRMDGRSMCSHRLRASAYCDPSEKVYPQGCKALKLAAPAAVGISEWLRWGMGQRAGTFETEVRATLAELKADVASFPDLALVPVLQACLARWKPNLDKLAQLDNELGHAPVGSRDPDEWNQALQGALKTVGLLHEAFVAFHAAATDRTANLTDQYEAMVAAMTAVEEKLVEIGPRLLYAFDDDEAQWLVEHVPHWFTNCAGNLYHWRRHAGLPKRPPQDRSVRLPSAFRDAWKHVLRLSDFIAYALGDSNVVQARGSRARRRRRCRASHRNAESDFIQGREDTIAEKIRELIDEGRAVTSEAVSAKCAGSDGSGIPAGTVRSSKAWKRRKEIAADRTGDLTYLEKYKPVPAFSSDQTPLDEPGSSES